MIENPFNQSLTGQEIKDWIWYNQKNSTIYTSMAKGMNAFFNLSDDKLYMLKLCGEVPIYKEVSERGIKYEILCDD